MTAGQPDLDREHDNDDPQAIRGAHVQRVHSSLPPNPGPDEHACPIRRGPDHARRTSTLAAPERHPGGAGSGG